MKPHTSVSLIDATLREGFQAPNTLFSLEDVIQISRAITQCGADMIEVGHPYVSSDAMRHTCSVVDMGLGLPVLAHARASRSDILAVAQSGAEWIGIFIGVNEISQRARLGHRSADALLSLISDGVGYARSLGLTVRFTIEDASRTDWVRLSKAYATAIAAGAERICFADSVGVMEPDGVTQVVTRLCQTFPDIEVEVHFHNDRGLAMANSLAAVDAGANWISVSVNGLGERCGITDHAVLATNLAYRGTRDLTEANARSMAFASAEVARCSGQPIPKAHPVLGEYAFTHTARLHVLAVEKDSHSYEWFDPRRIGRQHITMPLTKRREIDA